MASSKTIKGMVAVASLALALAAAPCAMATDATQAGAADGEMIGSVDPVGRSGVMTGTARPGARISVEDPTGQDVTSAIAREDGSFSVALPAVTNLSDYEVKATLGDESQKEPLSDLADSATLDWLGSDKAEYTRQLLAYASQGQSSDGSTSSDRDGAGHGRTPRAAVIAAGAASCVIIGIPAGICASRAARRRRDGGGGTRSTVEIPPIDDGGMAGADADAILSEAEKAGDDDLERLALRTDAMARIREAAAQEGRSA